MLYHSSVETKALVDDVKSFLADMRFSLPELFAARRPEAVVPRSVEKAVPGYELVPAVAQDAPLKASVPVPPSEYRSFFRSRVDVFAPLLGVSYGRVSVKDQRSLWASCSQEGNLNFSWRLLLAPDAVLDYIVVHELAHRIEMNHSRRFWSVVERLCPEHRSHRRWLRKNARALHLAPGP